MGENAEKCELFCYKQSEPSEKVVAEGNIKHIWEKKTLKLKTRDGRKREKLGRREWEGVN